MQIELFTWNAVRLGQSKNTNLKDMLKPSQKTNLENMDAKNQKPTMHALAQTLHCLHLHNKMKRII